MISTIPVLIVFISLIFKTEKINFTQILGLILSITGVDNNCYTIRLF
jgi:drug/metabolite transporter (DMT)-like permease